MQYLAKNLIIEYRATAAATLDALNRQIQCLLTSNVLAWVVGGVR